MIFSGRKKLLELKSKLDFLERENDSLKKEIQFRKDIYRELSDQVIRYFETREKKEVKTWKLIDSNGERWIRPEGLTYIGPLSDSGFEIIVDSNLIKLKLSSLEEAINVRSMLVSVDKIPQAGEYDESQSSLGKDKDKEKIKRIFSKKIKKENSIPEDLSTKINVDELKEQIKNKKK